MNFNGTFTMTTFSIFNNKVITAMFQNNLYVTIKIVEREHL